MTEAELNEALARADKRGLQRIHADLQYSFGDVAHIVDVPGTDGQTVGWTILGCLTLKRDLVPVCDTTDKESPDTRNHRIDLLDLVRAAYDAGRKHGAGKGRDLEAAVDAAVDVMDAGTHTAADVVHAAIGAYLGEPIAVAPTPADPADAAFVSRMYSL